MGCSSEGQGCFLVLAALYYYYCCYLTPSSLQSTFSYLIIFTPLSRQLCGVILLSPFHKGGQRGSEASMIATGRDKVVSPARTSWRVNVGSGASLLEGGGWGGVFFVLSPCHTPKGGPFSSPFTRESGNLMKMKVGRTDWQGRSFPPGAGCEMNKMRRQMPRCRGWCFKCRRVLWLHTQGLLGGPHQDTTQPFPQCSHNFREKN